MDLRLRTTTRPVSLLGVLGFISVVGWSTSVEGEELRLAPEVGARFHLVYDQATSQRTEVEGKFIEMTFNMGMEMDWTVTSVNDDNSLTVEMRFTRFHLLMESSEVEPITYDTARDDNSGDYYGRGLEKTLQPFLENDIEVVISAQGIIESVAIPAETMEAIREAPGSMQIRELLTQDGISETLSGTLCELPLEAVETGDIWEQQRESELSNGKLIQNHRYEFAGSEQSDGLMLNRIDVETELEFVQPEDLVQQPQTIKTQSLHGSIHLNPETGFFHGSEFFSQLVTEAPYRDTMIETVAEGNYSLTVSLVDPE